MKLEAMLDAHDAELRRFVRAHSGQLLRRETEEDLVQGITLRALERANAFRDRGAPVPRDEAGDVSLSRARSCA